VPLCLFIRFPEEQSIFQSIGAECVHLRRREQAPPPHMSFSEPASALLEVRLLPDAWPVIMALPICEKATLCFLPSTTSASLRFSEWQEES